MRNDILEFPRDLSLEAEHAALAGVGHQVDLPRLAGLETHRGAGWDVEPHATRRLTLEAQRVVGLEEVVVRANLDRPVARGRDLDRHALRPRVELDLAGFYEQLAGNHRCTCVCLGVENTQRASLRAKRSNP